MFMATSFSWRDAEVFGKTEKAIGIKWKLWKSNNKTSADGKRETIMNDTATDYRQPQPVPERGEPVYQGENYGIQIETLEFGYVLSVGCKRFAFETKERLLANLTEYLADPAKAQQKWWETKQPLK